MTLLILVLIFASVGWADFQNVNTSCVYPFEPVGDSCYFFSEEQRNYQGAVTYCNSLAQSDAQVSMAMLGFDPDADQELLEALMAKNETFWLGGYSDDGVNYKWQDGRDVDMNAPYWFYTEPNEQGRSCLTAQGHANPVGFFRSALYDDNCDDKLNFVCQIGCPFDFVRIQNRCYFHSEEIGLEKVTWADARDFCQGIEAPDGYHIDLAVLGLPNEDTYSLMNTLSWGHSHMSSAWVGGYEQSECVYVWVDGRILSQASVYWEYAEPDCGSGNYVWLEPAIYAGFNRSVLRDSSSGTNAFICQMFGNQSYILQ